MRKAFIAIAAAVAVVFGALVVPAFGALTATTTKTVHACVSSNHTFTHVSIGKALSCPSQQPVSWPGDVPVSSSPTSSPSPSPSQTSASPSPSPSSSGSAQCTTTQPTGTPCQLAASANIDGSNGYNTYGGNNCWADPSCTATSVFYDPGNWHTTITEPTGNTSVLAYPTVQQLESNQAIPGMGSLTSTYAEDMGANSGTRAWAAYDLWLNNWADEVLIAVDNDNVDPTYLPVMGHFTAGGQSYTAYDNGSERVVVADSNNKSGTVDLLAVLTWLQNNGHIPAQSTLTAVDFGWEVNSTGSQAETFSVTGYSLRSS